MKGIIEGCTQDPYLTRQHKSDQRWWACQYKKFSAVDWEKVIWSDKCYVHLRDDRGWIYITHCPSKILLRNVSFRPSSDHLCVSWFGIPSWRKERALIVLEYPGGRGGGMNSKCYQEQVLDGVLKAFYAQMEEERGSILFQHDGAPSHMSKSTKRWFTQNQIPLLFHPASSPDLNPIKPVGMSSNRFYAAFPTP